MQLERWLKIGCTQIIDEALTLSYMHLGLPSKIWRPVLGSSHVAAVTPVSSLPWASPALPESAEFFGFVVESMDMAVPTDSELQGTYQGPIQLSRRLITLKINSVAKTARGTNYGRQWLYNVLSKTGQPGPSANACGKSSCPHFGGQVRLSCDPDTVRNLIDVRLKSFEIVSNPVDVSCAGESYLIVLTARAEVALQPTVVAMAQTFGFTAADAHCVGFVTLAQQINRCQQIPICKAPGCNSCDFCDDLAITCGCSTCVGKAQISCYCHPIISTARVFELTSIATKPAAAKIEIKAGNSDVKNMSIALYHDDGVGNKRNPELYPQDWVCSHPCAELLIPGLCKNTTLVIDAVERTAYVYADSNPTVIEDAMDLIWSPTGAGFRWPRVLSGKAWIVITGDWYNTGEDTTVSLFRSDLEMV